MDMYWKGDIVHIHYYAVRNRRQTDKYGKQSLEISNTVGPMFTLSCEKSRMRLQYKCIIICLLLLLVA